MTKLNISGESNRTFRLRGFYPNYFSVRQVLSGHRNKQLHATDPGFPKPELEFRSPGDTEPHCVDLKNIDVFILTQSDRQKAAHYLDLLLASLKRNAAARKEKDMIAEEFRKRLKVQFGKLEFTENDSVVPASTNNTYDELLLSQKGKVLLDLYHEGYPVPDFCVLTSRSYQLNERERETCLQEAISNLEKMTGEKLGDADHALVFAMRSATPFYIPGLMPTFLNVGVTKLTYRSLYHRYGRPAADKIYLNNLQSICQILAPGQDFYRSNKEDCDSSSETTEEKIKVLFNKIKRIDEQILYDAKYQAIAFMRYSHSFFTRNQDLIYTFQRGHPTFPALILQKMVWTIRNHDSYPGVLYSRHPRTGLGMQIESGREIFGEEIMTGTIRAEEREYFNRNEIKEEFPAIYHFTPMLPQLEVRLKSPATIEFAVESFEGASFFAILQLNMSELTGRSTLLAAIDLYQKKIITKKRVIQLIRPYHLRQIFSERIDDVSLKSLTFFGQGVSILPRSAVSARIFFSMAKALEAKRKGEKVCLCKENFIPSETIFMGELDAIMSMSPLAIHVVTACLGYGIPAFINLRNHNMYLTENTISNMAGTCIREGEWITVSSKHHCIYLGKAHFKPARFQKYLEGQSLEMDPKEEKVFINMSRAYLAYQEIVNTLKTEEAMTLPDLIKLIRNDYDQKPEKAIEFVNGWFDVHMDYYYTEILKSGLGSHLDQHKIYNLLTTGRRIQFFRDMILKCQKEKLHGFSAGAFMLGRFLCQPHPGKFWSAFTPSNIVFMLNEYILFEKYMQVLYEFGERHLNRTKNKILTDDLNTITLSSMDTDTFLTLKLCSPDWKAVEEQIGPEHEKDTLNLIRLLKQPYGSLIHYDLPWSFEKIRSICETEKMKVPDPAAL
jgi:phosphoenolpyruvate synthase/pyruvate phosphate dikinase